MTSPQRICAGLVKEALEDAHRGLRGLAVPGRHGRPATYIPELGRADPRRFGLAVMTLDGNLHQAGDALVPFTIQSVSKPFVYALTLADLGVEETLNRIGVEPTGAAFNAVRPQSARPGNPMVNAGAIVASSLVAGASGDERFGRIAACLSAFAGRDLVLDEQVLRSERSTADHNRALAHLMRASGVLERPAEEALEVYFRQCSLLVTAGDLAVMTATLANEGINPLTGQKIVSPEVTEIVLSVMATCGTYDYAGEWMLRAGLPAKSGVSGGLAAAAPGRLGIGVFSPLLDERGNSVRGLAACEQLSRRLGLHVMRP
jgi:glutaminase